MRAVVDTSALVAILLEEPEEPAFQEFLLEAQALISAATAVELCRVAMARLGPAAVPPAKALLLDYEIEIVPVTELQVEIALQAMLAYGRGRSMAPAVLNFGDLFSYALAKELNLPLLYKGGDFAATDIEPALA
jgi:ribonuclease VapC